MIINYSIRSLDEDEYVEYARNKYEIDYTGKLKKAETYITEEDAIKEAKDLSIEKFTIVKWYQLEEELDE